MNYPPIMIALVLGAAVLICGCTVPSGSETRNQANGTPVGENLTIAEVLDREDNFSILLDAFDTAGIEKTLAGEGPYTIFAPTDEAFHRLSDEAVEELFDDPRGHLAEVLLYHLAPGNLMIDGIAANETVATVQGNPIAVGASGGSVTVDGAEVVRADIPAANGVVHVIDAVLLPPDVILPATNETVANVTTNETG